MIAVLRKPTRPLLLLLIVLALGLTPSRPTSAVGDNCLYECQGPICSDFGNHSDMCQELRAKCQARCSGRRWWGAIAYSTPDKQYGYAFDFNNVNDAKKQAMDRCSKTGRACKIWAYYENECGAIAADGNIVTWGTAFLRQNAEQRAMQECKKAGGRNCAIQAWSCSKM
jgi:hypothetical protein